MLDYHLKLLSRNEEKPIDTSFFSEKSLDLYEYNSKEEKKVAFNPSPQKNLHPIVERNSSEEKTGKKKEENKVNDIEEVSLPLEVIDSLNVVLIIDNREVKSQDDRAYIYQNLLDSGLDCEMGSLPLGDFLWIARVKGCF